MTDKLTIALAQIDPTVGDIRRNADRILAARQQVMDADLVVFFRTCVVRLPARRPCAETFLPGQD